MNYKEYVVLSYCTKIHCLYFTFLAYEKLRFCYELPVTKIVYYEFEITNTKLSPFRSWLRFHIQLNIKNMFTNNVIRDNS